PSLDSVNPVGRQGEACGVEVGGGEAELAAQPVPANDCSSQRVGTAEHLTGGIQIPCLNGFADAGTADGLVIERDGGHAMNGEVQFHAELPEQSNVTASFVAEHKIRTHT